MIIPKSPEDIFAQTWHNNLLDYHLEISNQLPNPQSHRYLSKLSSQELFSSLQLSVFMLTNSLLTDQQLQYETQLRAYEDKLRAQYRIRLQMKLKVDAMENKLRSLLSKAVDESAPTKRLSVLLAQKENEILILRAENSNLKATIAAMESNEAKSGQSLNPREKGSTNNNINININDISNSKVIIKTSERFTSPLTPIKQKKQDYYLSSSKSNRNIFFGYYKGSWSPNKLGQGCAYGNKVNGKDKGVNEKSCVISTSSPVKKKSAAKEVSKLYPQKSSMSNLIVYSSYSNSQNNTVEKATMSTPRADTYKDVPKYPSKKR